MSSAFGLAAATVTLTTPLLLAALGENIVELSGVVNVGLEGMILTGALAAILGARMSGTAEVGLLTGMLGAVLLGALFALFVLRLRANQVVTGVVLNLLALGVTGSIYRRLFGATGAFVQAPRLHATAGGITILTPLALVAAAALTYWLYRTGAGLRLRACGEQPAAAESTGANVLPIRAAAILFGGAMAGLAGAFLSIADVPTFVEDMSAGRGFIALAVVTAGRWKPAGCLLAAALFGLVNALQFRGQALGLHIPHQLFVMLPYLATLLVLTFGGRLAPAPASLGKTYQRA